MKKEEKKKNSRFLLIFICVFVLAALLLGAVLGIVSAVTSARTAASYNRARMSEGALRAFMTSYKSSYVAALIRSGVSMIDHESFWSSDAGDGQSYGEIMAADAEKKLREYIVRAALFDSVTSLTGADKTRINNACRDVLESRAGGDERAFNALTAPYGFTYSDMKEMTTVVYKAERALEAFYGEDGERVIYRDDGKCEEYLNTYSHIYILFIRTEDTFIKDESGNRVEENGTDSLRQLTDAERAERAEVIKTVRDAIEAKNSGGDMIITKEMFFQYIDKYSDNTADADADGYYLKSGTAYTEQSREEAPELTEAALEMAVGEFREVAFDEAGVCFIYRSEPKAGAYLLSKDGDSLSDFCVGAAKYCFEGDVDAFVGEVVLTEKYYLVDITKIKYTNQYFPLA